MTPFIQYFLKLIGGKSGRSPVPRIKNGVITFLQAFGSLISQTSSLVGKSSFSVSSFFISCFGKNIKFFFVQIKP